MSSRNNLKVIDKNKQEVIEKILMGRKKDRLIALNVALNNARQNFENLFQGIVLGMDHDPDEEDCVLLPTEGGGLKIVFGPKDSLTPDGKLKPQDEKKDTIKPDQELKTAVE